MFVVYIKEKKYIFVQIFDGLKTTSGGNFKNKYQKNFKNLCIKFLNLYKRVMWWSGSV